MQLISPVKVIAACAGLTGFAIAMLAGLAAENPADVILARAIAALVVCYVAGGVIGLAMDHAVRAGIEDYKAERPSPLGEDDSSGTRQSA
jgi:hypothetical protein